MGTGADMERYRKYVKKHDIDRISFEGEQNPEPYYSSASIFLMTSPAEGWGLTITESLQRGVVPVIMNSSPVFSEIIENDESGILVKDNNLKEFQVAIETLMDNDNLRISLAKNGLQRAELFSKENTIIKWKKLIDMLMTY